MNKQDDIPQWAVESGFGFEHASKMIKAYAKEVLHMSPTKFAIKNGSDGEFVAVVWNSRRWEEVDSETLGYYWKSR